MRNSFATKNKGYSDLGVERLRAAQAISPDQVAIIWQSAREVLAVSPSFNQSINSYSIDFSTLPADLNLKSNLDFKRTSQFNIPPISEKTRFLTITPDFSERTRVLALNGNILSLSDSELTEWFVNAENTGALGTDGHPIFETSLGETSSYFNRLPNGQVSITEVPRDHIESVQQKIQSLFGGKSQNLVIETPLRSVARYFLTSQAEGEDILRKEKEHEVTAFLLIGKSGFSYGLWSPYSGLFSEEAFAAPAEIKALVARRMFGQNENEPEAERKQQRQNWEVYIRQAFDQLYLQLSPEKLEQMELSDYAQAVWISEPEIAKLIAPLTEEYAANSGLEFIRVESPYYQAIAGGLLLGSFTFGNDELIGANVVQPINMSRDILDLADRVEVERSNQQEIAVFQNRDRAVFALWVAPVLLLACLIGFTFNIFRSQIMSGIRELRADAKALELKPAVDRRKNYETSLKWYQEFIKQISELRRQQPVGTNLLYELNSNYPIDLDPSFYISEMKLNVNGGVEIKGLANTKDAVTSFLRSLEFAGGNESGKKLFSNLTYEVQEGVATTNAPAASQAKLPTMSGSTLSGSNPAPGVIAWSIRGNYLPAVEFAPPDPSKKPKPNQPPANANAANAPPANAPNQPPANTAR